MHASLSGFRVARPATRADQVREFLREQVLSGALPPGTRLPATKELAQRWGVTIACLQAAVGPLVRDGLLLRRRRVGTIVRERASGFARVALYRPSEPAREGRDRFAPSLAATLAQRLRARGAGSEMFTDLRPLADQATPPPDLERALRERRIDAVIACESDLRTGPWLARLPVPVAAMTPEPWSNGVWFDHGQFAREAVACLARRGCRRVGLISVLTPQRRTARGAAHPFRALRDGFLAAAAEHGVAVRDRWLRQPAEDVFIAEADAERFGYESARAAYAGRERPDGFVVFSDLAARGVVMALMAASGDGRGAPRLALHRNAGLGFFSPLPADFLEIDGEVVGDALIEVIERQRRGEPVAHVLLPFRVVVPGRGRARAGARERPAR